MWGVTSSGREGSAAGNDLLTASGRQAVAPESPAAIRARLRWQDARLVLGAVLMVVSGAAVSVVVARADQRVEVWAAVRDLSPGTELRPADLVAVAFAGPEPSIYLPVSDGLPVGQLSRAVGAGEVIAAGSVGGSARGTQRLVTVEATARRVPAGLAAGDRVDVWFTATESSANGSEGSPNAQLVLPGVVVADSPIADELGGELQAVTLQVGIEDVGRLVTASRAGALDLVRVPYWELPA